MASGSQRPLEQAYHEVKTGQMSRRGFLERAMALGVGLPVAAVLANHLTFGDVAAQEATPAAVQGRPSFGTENQERGAGGELRLIQWQAVSTLSPHNATGTKDSLGAALVLEPLLSYLPDGSLLPNLVTEVPSLENGGAFRRSHPGHVSPARRGRLERWHAVYRA